MAPTSSDDPARSRNAAGGGFREVHTHATPVDVSEAGFALRSSDASEAAAAVAAEPRIDLKTQVVRFIITGALSGVVDFGLTLLLMHVGLGHTGAKAIGFVCGTTTAYLLNRRWTFQAPPSKSRFVSVALLYAITFGVQVGLFDVMFGVLPGGVLYTFIAYCIAQGAATVINFVVQRLVIFKLN